MRHVASLLSEGPQKSRERRAAMGCCYNAMPLHPMSTFDPERPCRVHDVLDDKNINWKKHPSRAGD